MIWARQSGSAGLLHVGAWEPRLHSQPRLQRSCLRPSHPFPHQPPTGVPERQGVRLTLFLWKLAFPQSVISLTQVCSGEERGPLELLIRWEFWCLRTSLPVGAGWALWSWRRAFRSLLHFPCPTKGGKKLTAFRVR